MARILEALCKKFARDRNIILQAQPDSLYGKGNGLEVKYADLGLAGLFGVEKQGESLVTLAYSQLPSKEERIVSIELKRWCFLDYLTLLRNTPSEFAQIARKQFEFYLDGLTTQETYTKEFTDANAIDALSVLNSFYPPLLKLFPAHRK